MPDVFPLNRDPVSPALCASMGAHAIGRRIAALRLRYRRFAIFESASESLACEIVALNTNGGHRILSAPFGVESLEAASWKRGFPGSLDGAAGTAPDKPYVIGDFVRAERGTQLWSRLQRRVAALSAPNAAITHMPFWGEALSPETGSRWHCAPYMRRAYNLETGERNALARMLREYAQGWTSEGATRADLIEFLNDAGAEARVLDSINRRFPELDLRFAVDCGHFCRCADAVRGVGGRGSVCYACAGGGYVLCEDSDRYIAAGDAHWNERRGGYSEYEDDDEEEEEEEDGLRNYSDDVCRVLRGPETESTSDGPFTIGVEFEVETPRRRAFVEAILAAHGRDVIVKSDGSLDDDEGAEIVTRPMLPQAAHDLFESMEFGSGTRAWDAGGCGLHVHIDSRAFTPLTLAKFIAFWNLRGNYTLIKRVAGRHPVDGGTAASYANLDDADEQEASLVARLKKSNAGSSRYRVVNLTCLKAAEAIRLGVSQREASDHLHNTIELRIFRASLRKERLLAQIDMAVASVYFARETSMEHVRAEDFNLWLRKNARRFKPLARFLGVTRKKSDARQAVEA